MKNRLNRATVSLILSLVILAFVLADIPKTIEIRRIVRQQQLVSVNLLNEGKLAPAKDGFSYLRFRYQGHEHQLKIGSSFRQKIKGLKSVGLLHSTRYPDLFLLPDYDVNSEVRAHIFAICASGFIAALMLFTATRHHPTA